MLDRREVLKMAIEACYREMYAKAQPSADWDALVRDARDGKIKKDEKVYERYYLSDDEFQYITNKYMDAYRINSEWGSDVDVVKDFLREGGKEEVYNENKGDKEFVDILPLKDELEVILHDKELAESVEKCVMDKIDKCKMHYKFNGDEMSFRFETALGPSPTSNKDTVINYWKEKGVDIQIEDRDKDTFWYRDEYGDDWKDNYE